MLTLLIDYLGDFMKWLVNRPGRCTLCNDCSPSVGLCDKHKRGFRSSNKLDNLLGVLLLCRMVGYFRDGKPVFPNYVETNASELRLFCGNYYKILSLYTTVELLTIVQTLNGMPNRTPALTSLRNTIRNHVNS